MRKHKGINQQTGKLKKGYKYIGKKTKSGLPIIQKAGGIFNKKNTEPFKPLLDLSKYPQVKFENKSSKHLPFFIHKNNANNFCSMSHVLPNAGIEAFKDYNNGIIASVNNTYIGFLFFTTHKRNKLQGGNYFKLELICNNKNKEDR